MLKQAIAVTALGALLVTYALTAEVLPFVRDIPGAPREVRLGIFAIGLLAFCIGFALVLNLVEHGRGSPNRDE